MLFDLAIRRELARSFGAVLLVLFTITLTLMLIRTLGLATRGSVNPQEVMLVLGYTAMGQLPVILSLGLLLAVVSTLARMHADSEMVIWMTCGRGLSACVAPVFRFAWPVLLVVLALVLLVWPWANDQMYQLRQRFEQRGDLARVAPGQFQESADGRRVFFIDKDSREGAEGRNVFILTRDRFGTEQLTSARGATVQQQDGDTFLVLRDGERVEQGGQVQGVRLSRFDEYHLRTGESGVGAIDVQSLRAESTWSLWRAGDAARMGELGWRLGLGLTAFNVLLLGVATGRAQPRRGRTASLMFALLVFIVYFNLINLGQAWVASGRINVWAFLVLLHGGVLALSLLWLAARHLQWHWRDLLARPGTDPVVGPT